MTLPRNEALREIEGFIRQFIKRVIYQPNRKPFYWGGLEGYEQLEAIAKALSKIPNRGVDPRIGGQDKDYLERLSETVNRVLKHNRLLYKDLKAAHTLLCKVAECLRYPIRTPTAGENTAVDVRALSSQQIRREMEALIKRSQYEREQFPAHTVLAQKLQRAWKAYGMDLLPCYDIAGLPPDNLKLEALFGRVRRHQRRISGRKTTKALQEFGQYQVLFLATSEVELLEQLQQVPISEYRKHRQRLAKAEEPRQRQYRFHRNPLKAIWQLVKEHHACRAALTTSSLPDLSSLCCNEELSKSTTLQEQ